MGTEAKYLVYSREHNAWWGPNGAGYPVKMEDAGRYTLAEAKNICSVPLHRGGDSGDGPTEFYMLAPECAASADLLGEAVEAVRAAYSGYVNYYGGEPKELVASLAAFLEKANVSHE